MPKRTTVTLPDLAADKLAYLAKACDMSPSQVLTQLIGRFGGQLEDLFSLHQEASNTTTKHRSASHDACGHRPASGVTNLHQPASVNTNQHQASHSDDIVDFAAAFKVSAG